MTRPMYATKEKNLHHGDPKRFFCEVHLDGEKLGEGWGGSRKDAEQEAARYALEQLTNKPNLCIETQIKTHD